MPREIEFRCWSPKKKRWADEIEVFKDGSFTIGFQEENIEGVDGLKGTVYQDDDQAVLNEWTGLRDSKGVKVFEGDIVVKNCYLFFDNGKPNYRGVVEWIYSQWQVVLYCINPEKGGISDGINEGLNDEGFEEGANSDWEVIGNIYQNTELLEVQND